MPFPLPPRDRAVSKGAIAGLGEIWHTLSSRGKRALIPKYQILNINDPQRTERAPFAFQLSKWPPYKLLPWPISPQI